MTEAPKKKLIEVALPLEEINAACKADKDRKTGTIRNIHKWFAPAPLPAWRALIFAALIDDPGEEVRRAELLDVIKRLVANGADLPEPHVLNEAKDLLRKQFPDGVPSVMDPFCGGGSTLVEGQRLGLQTFGSDLNPVPVLITRALTETLPRVFGGQPLHPAGIQDARGKGRAETVGQTSLGAHGHRTYSGYEGVQCDVSHYAELIREEAWTALAANFPSQNGEKPIAWIWARTAICPNPACGIETVLATSWWLSKRVGDFAWIEPTVTDGCVELDVITGQADGSAPPPPKVGDGVFECVACRATLDGNYLRGAGKRGQLGLRITAMVSDVGGRRRYRAPTSEDVSAASLDLQQDVADVAINVAGQGIRVGLYGMDRWNKLYTGRQLLTLTTFADLVASTHERVQADGGTKEWADAVTTILGLALGKLAHGTSTQNRWKIDGRSVQGVVESAFARNDLPMSWDFVEGYPFAADAKSWLKAVSTLEMSMHYVPHGDGETRLSDARHARTSPPGLVATDPPYFDAIGYADLSDYFYVWHRRALRGVHPDLYETVAAPKVNELTAIPSHHGGSKAAAREYFIHGFTETFTNLKQSLNPTLPMLVVYASKEQKTGKGEETRWESILTAMIDADLEITGTWPIHMTSSARMISLGTNAVAAYVVMVCRPRRSDAVTTSLSDFSRALRRELPSAIRDLQAGSILPVDLYQAALGPGMRIFSRYRLVEDSHGARVPVARALELITGAVSEVLDEQEGELDAASRFAVTWWEQYSWEPGPFGQADKIARQYGTHVDDVVRSEVVTSGAGKVQLLGDREMNRGWTPAQDSKPTAWEAVHHLIDRLINGGGETEAAALLAQLGNLQESARTLAYRLHDIAAKKGWAAEQERYNALIGRWTSMLALAATHESAEGLF